MNRDDIQKESDYRWIERAAILAGDRKLTDEERRLVNEEILAFEKEQYAQIKTQEKT